MKLVNIPFIIITISLLFGILIGYHLDINSTLVLFFLAVSLTCLIISWFTTKKMFRKRSLFSSFTISTFLLFGITLIKIHNPKIYPEHYTNNFSLEDLYQTPKGVKFYITERLKSSSFYEKYIVTLKLLNGKKCKGKLLLQIPKKDLFDLPKIGDLYITYSNIEPIPRPLNPYQYNYASYLNHQGIFHKIAVTPDKLTRTNVHQWSLQGIASEIRAHINQKLCIYELNMEQLSIINALFLGQRQDIDPKVLSYYKNAGVLHILAVSGLHVGILMMLLNFLLKPLDYFRKKTKVLKIVIILVNLWLFALITGMSPSILRATTMFSFITIALHYRSKTSIYNALFISMFLLLCFNPQIIFSIGFQLSYIAVFSIVWIQPSLAKFYQPKFFIDKKLWEVFTVTISAQMGLLPLTLFHFHQFPILFFITNLMILPFLGFILGFGILIIILSQLDFLENWLVKIFGSCIDYMNYICLLYTSDAADD